MSSFDPECKQALLEMLTLLQEIEKEIEHLIEQKRFSKLISNKENDL